MTQVKTFKILSKSGLHARPASILVKEASKFSSDIYITHNASKVTAKSIMSVLGLGISHGAEIEIEATGSDALKAIQSLTSIVESNFGEK